MQIHEVTVSDGSTTLNPAEFGEFLFLFPAVCRALSQFVPSDKQADLRQPDKSEIANYRKSLANLSPEQLDSLFYSQQFRDVIQISHISRRSPLEITLCGCAFLVTLAVLFSGGKISITSLGLKAELPPFGKGLKSLREALGLDKRVQAAFGIRETTIKLNRKEYDALIVQDDASKNKGGFQHFLVGLKNRINKQTYELQLSPSDLERIHRYKANPRKGGWQSRFKKIFGRHFPDEDLLIGA